MLQVQAGTDHQRPVSQTAVPKTVNFPAIRRKGIHSKSFPHSRLCFLEKSELGMLTICRV